jgi:hypothetical protein
VGTGQRNTQVVVERLRQLRESGRAAQLCASLDSDGYEDWFLPSKDELNLMYQNLKLKGLGGFSDGWYWSSSQNWHNESWSQNFSGGKQDVYYKGITYSVRAIRSF